MGMKHIGYLPTNNLRPIGKQYAQANYGGGVRGCNVFGSNTTIINNNVYGGGGYSGGCYGNMYANTGQCGGGNNKFLNLMMGLGIGTTILGGVLNMFGIGGNQNQQYSNYGGGYGGYDTDGYGGSTSYASKIDGVGTVDEATNKQIEELKNKQTEQQKEIEDLKTQSKVREFMTELQGDGLKGEYDGTNYILKDKDGKELYKGTDWKAFQDAANKAKADGTKPANITTPAEETKPNAEVAVNTTKPQTKSKGKTNVSSGTKATTYVPFTNEIQGIPKKPWEQT